jgi:hypothetical protein
MPKRKKQRKQRKKSKTTKTKMMKTKSRQPAPADPVTRAGLPPSLLPVLPQLDVEELLRPVAEMVSALGRVRVPQLPVPNALQVREAVRDAMAAVEKTHRSESPEDT